jgi:steroid 5-alpha reductase family enzyme
MLVPRASLDLALPLVKKLPECADFSKTVQPYLPQLYDLPYRILESINDREALQHIYVSTNPLMSGLAFALFMTPIVFVVAEINRNYSQVDRLWSILPVIYNVHYDVWAHLNGLPAARVDHVMALSVIWGARLTFNYWRKGGYQVGSEDYRWNIVKDYVGPIPMFIFNIVFISLAQNVSAFCVGARSGY